MSTTRFEDLNDDCLEPIFKSLDLNSLFTVALLNPRFLHIARYAFNRVFGGARFCIENARIKIKNDTTTVHIGEFTDFFGCFGNSIHRVKMDYSLYPATTIEMTVFENAVNDHCFNALKRLEVRGSHFFRPGPIFTIINRPFPKVVTAIFERVQISPSLACIDRWFPNIEKLVFSECLIDATIIPGHLSKLINLN